MKNNFNILILFIITLLTITGIFAISLELSEEFQDPIKKVTEEGGIDESEIINITEVDYNKLPNEIDLGNIDNTNLGIYKIRLIDKSIFMVISSNKNFQKISPNISISYSTSFLNFSFSGEQNSSFFINTSTSEKNYTMTKNGSVTGILTNLEVVENSSENIEIIIYKNGKPIGFGNVIDASTIGVKKDFDFQSRDIVTFNSGDIISVFIKAEGISFKNVITAIEITTEN